MINFKAVSDYQLGSLCQFIRVGRISLLIVSGLSPPPPPPPPKKKTLTAEINAKTFLNIDISPVTAEISWRNRKKIINMTG